MSTEWEFLIQPLRDEMQEHGALLNLFEEQQAAILRREPDLVLHVAEAITKQAELIRECQKRRTIALRAAAVKAGCAEEIAFSKLLPHLPEPAWPLLQALTGEVNRLVRQTRRRARQNQMLLARTIEVSQELLRRFSPGAVSKTYSAQGRVAIDTTEKLCRARS
jgi:flagellar biosynthesis/type III secretory pathway chaperone